MSELIREALRCYERQRWWDEMNAYGREKAMSAGASSEQDVVRAVHEYRQVQRRAHKKRTA